MIKVSVIVPVYNVECYLERCIQSVLNQTYQNIELILVDDGSTDRSGFICDNYQNRDSRIQVLHKQNGGVSSARNAALDIAAGDYIMFLDSDDALDLNAVEFCVKSTENDAWDVVLFGFHMYTESSGNVFFQKDVVYRTEDIDSKKQMLCHFSEYYRKGYFNFITDKIIRRSLITDNRIRFRSQFDIGGEDGVFILELASYLSSVKVTDKAFYQYYRRADESMTQLFRPQKFDRYYDRIVKLYQFMKTEKCFDSDYLVELYGTYFLWAYESTFHSSCSLSLFKRFQYAYKTFNKNLFFPEQRKIQRKMISRISAFFDYSRSSLVALKLFYKRSFFALGVWNVLTFFLRSR